MSNTIGPIGHVSTLSTDAVLNCPTITPWYGYAFAHDAESAAIAEVSRQLAAIPPDARARVLAYLQARYGAESR